MKSVTGVLRFGSDFIIGDDWRVAAAVVVALGLTALLVHKSFAGVAVLVFLGVSLYRASRT